MISLENTVVVIVDVRSNQGAIQIADKQSNEYVEGVGTEASRIFGHDPLEQELVVLLYGNYTPCVHREEDLRALFTVFLTLSVLVA